MKNQNMKISRNLKTKVEAIIEIPKDEKKIKGTVYDIYGN